MIKIVCIPNSDFMKNIARTLRTTKGIKVIDDVSRSGKKLNNTVAFIDLDRYEADNLLSLIKDLSDREIRVIGFIDACLGVTNLKFIDAGVNSIFVKYDSVTDNIAKVIESVNRTNYYLPNKLISPLLHAIEERKRANQEAFAYRIEKSGFSMTRKQIDIAYLLRKGFSNKEIALFLGISEGATKVHISRIYAKMGNSTRNEVIDIFDRLMTRRG